MTQPNNKTTIILKWIFLISLNLTLPNVTCDPRATRASSLICGSGRGGKATNVAEYIPTVVQVLERLSSNLNNSKTNFATSTSSKFSPNVFALIQCHKDLSHTDCLVCYAVSRTAVPGCLPVTAGRVFLDGCFVRYDNYSFFSESVDPQTDTRNCNSTSLRGGSDFKGGILEFNRSVGELVENVTKLALSNSGFGVMEWNGIYGLAQCWERLSVEECRVCLDSAKKEVMGCVPSGDGRGMNAGCFLRYSTQKFYENDSQGDGGNSESNTIQAKRVILVTALTIGVGMILVGIILCFIRKLKQRKKVKNNVIVDKFLKNHEFLAPKKYSYSQIKKMTNSFKNKLGQGGFSSVYEGKLTSGSIVAVKVLSELKGNGEDFINEVASVGRTAHVNIVNLLGFCCEGHERALIYEFMPNGSLEKFIYGRESSNNSQLGWGKLHQIAIGIARGLEYLHSGCNTRILHLDIKPHNILLDQDFCPKISDFGLAKLFPEARSKISMSHMRGTPGYIAPELFSRNFGLVSNKSDVYSYGTMILEMFAGKEDIEVDQVDHTSDIYFPNSIYKKLHEEKFGLNEIVSDEENNMVRKTIIVGLWCIQTNPLNRPTITRVLEMLEGDIELEIPPKPYLSYPSRPVSSCSASTSFPSTK